MKTKLLTALLMAAVISTQAGTIGVGHEKTEFGVWTYGAVISNGVLDDTGLITIYDFAGYQTGSEFSPPDWTFSLGYSGVTPADLASVETAYDDYGIVNLTWHYTGPTITSPDNATSIDLGDFGACSFFPLTTMDRYVTRDRALPENGGEVSGSFSPVLVPAPIKPLQAVPESSSTAVLLGSAIIGLCLIRRGLTNN